MSIFGHQHRYEPVATESRTVLFSSAGSTIVLYRCRCEDVYSKVIDGDWTLSQVRGERNLTDGERVETDLLIEEAHIH